MEGFEAILPEAYSANFIRAIKDMGLLICGTPEHYNAMTVGWAQLGVLWGTPVVTVYVRPSRYTYTFACASRKMTLSFFGEECREALSFCGKVSGRDRDKLSECGLHPMTDGAFVTCREAHTVFCLETLYEQDLAPSAFLEKTPMRYYGEGQGGFHRAFVCGIKQLLVQEK